MPLSVEAILAVVFGISGSIVALIGVAFTYMAMKQPHQRQQTHDLEYQRPLSHFPLYPQPTQRYPASLNLSNFEGSALYHPSTPFGYFQAQPVPDVYLLSGNPLIGIGDHTGSQTQLVRVDSRTRYPQR